MKIYREQFFGSMGLTQLYDRGWIGIRRMDYSCGGLFAFAPVIVQAEKRTAFFTVNIAAAKAGSADRLKVAGIPFLIKL